MTAGSMLADSVAIAELADDPHPILARLRDEGPVSWVPALDGWLVTAHGVAVDVLADPAVFTVDHPRFSTAKVIGASMLSQDGAAHLRHREPFASAFRPAQVRRRFAEIVSAEVDRLISAMAVRETAELRSDLAAPLSVAVMRQALGLSEVDPGQLLEWYAAIVAAVSALTAGCEPAPLSGAAFASLSDQVSRELAAGGDSSLLRSAERAGLAAEEVVSNAAVLLFGGIETTEGMLANLAVHLLADPAACARVRSRPQVLDDAVTESLRLEPAAANVDRFATRDVTLCDARVRRGDLVIVSIAAANRDPAVFADPDRFDLSRANAAAQLAFAHGPHYCLGAHLARLEVHTAMARLLELFPRLRLTEPHLSRPAGLVFRKPAEVGVRWD